MLREIYISNFILIDELRLEFSPGLNVLTGETGAGKSIVVDALELLVGERISADMVKYPGEKKSTVEGVFEIEPGSKLALELVEQGLMDEDEELLVIRREISPQGRVTNRVNGHTVPASLLRNIADDLLDMHLQHDHQKILSPHMHKTLLDNYSEDMEPLLRETARIFSEWKETGEEIESLQETERRRMQDIDMYRYQIEEIEKADLREGEEEELLQERNRMVNAEKLVQASQAIETILGGDGPSAQTLVARAVDIARRAGDPFFDELAGLLEEAYFNLEEAGRRLIRFAEALEFEPVRLEQVEERLQQVSRLKKKYGNSVKDVLDYLDQLREKLDLLENLENRVDELQKKQAELWEKYCQLARELSIRRRTTAAALEERMRKELGELAMPAVQFKIEIHEGNPGPGGMDEVVFLFSANPGEPMRPIYRVASGGEISRVILALKAAVARAYKVPVLVFDEIDVGIGGQALLAVGEKLAQLSREHQVILVTHSPQIACLADHHLLLKKEVSNGRTRVSAEPLDAEGRIAELSRMLAGENITPAAREHARQMLEQASFRR